MTRAKDIDSKNRDKMSIFKLNELETNSKSMEKQKGAIKERNYQRKGG